MDRMHCQDNNASGNKDTGWTSSSWEGLADSHDDIRLPPERARADSIFMTRNSVNRTERRASSSTSQHDLLASTRSTFPLPYYIPPRQTPYFDSPQASYDRAATMPYPSYESFRRPINPYTYTHQDALITSSSTGSMNTQPSHDVYGSYGMPVAHVDPVMTNNAAAWSDGRTFRVNSPSASMSMVGAQFMDAHEFSGITNQLAHTSLSQSPVQASRFPEVAQQGREELHSDYRRINKPARYFTLGRVFMTLWTEPAGRQPNAPAERSRFSEVILGSHAFSEIRRFVVIKPGKGHCLCSPIHTYRGQGTLKEGVNSKEHAAIYLKSKGVQLLPGEKLTIEPFPLILENDKNVQIDISSRINFGKIYTVEHTVRVLNIGRIELTEIPRLQRLFSFNAASSTNDGTEAQDSDKSGER